MDAADIERRDNEGMQAWEHHNPDGFANLFADEFELHDWTLPEPIRDHEGVRDYMKAWLVAFPDMRVRQARRVVSDDMVAAEIEFVGTNSGPLSMGGRELPPTNRQVTGRGTYFARFSQGKIIEFRSHPDVAGLLTQLGMMPDAA